MSLPTLLFFKNGEPAPIRLAGAQSIDRLREALDKLLAL